MSGKVTKEEREQALRVDLAEFLLTHHPFEVKEKGGSVVLSADEHISVRKGVNCYINFRDYYRGCARDPRNSGNNIDYLMTWLGYGYVDAVYALIGKIDCFVTESKAVKTECKKSDEKTSHKKSKAAEFPNPVSAPWKRLESYLINRRSIRISLILQLEFEGLIFQDCDGNIVFSNPERTYCEMRGTNTFADTRCKRRNHCESYCKGEHYWCKNMDQCPNYKSDPFHSSRKSNPDGYWYFIPDGSTDLKEVYICEAAIDAISLYSLHKDKREVKNTVYVSIGGVGNQRVIDLFKKFAEGKEDAKVILAVDNDRAGEECRQRNYDLDFVIPKHKDWNEDLIELEAERNYPGRVA